MPAASEPGSGPPARIRRAERTATPSRPAWAGTLPGRLAQLAVAVHVPVEVDELLRIAVHAVLDDVEAGLLLGLGHAYADRRADHREGRQARREHEGEDGPHAERLVAELVQAARVEQPAVGL